MQEKEMLNDLIVESREHLEGIEPDLLELEEKKGSVSDDLINRVFRAVHSIKGGFGFFGFQSMVQLSHVMENVLALVRDKELNITSQLVDCLLKGIDKLRTLLDDVNNSDTVSIVKEVESFSPFIATNGSPFSTSNTLNSDSLDSVKKLHTRLTDEDVIESIKNGKYIYQITLHTTKHLSEKNLSIRQIFDQWEKFGVILDCIPEQKSIESIESNSDLPQEISVVFATVLESDLIADAVEINDEHIFAINLTTIKQSILKQNSPLKNTRLSQQNDAKSTSDVRHDTHIEEALRVKVSLLNNLMNFAGELVLSRNQLIQTMNRKLTEDIEIDKKIKDAFDVFSQSVITFAQNYSKEKLVDSGDSLMQSLNLKLKEIISIQLRDILNVGSIVQNIDMVTTLLQESIMQTRMQPISVVFSKFPRVIRDLAKKLGKQITLNQIGQDVELDKSIIELLSDPLTHLIRNCADHGIELPEEREKSGKDPMGIVMLKAYQEGGKVIIEISDDGAGIDPEIIKETAIRKQVITKEKAETLSLKELQLLIFLPGFSTAQTVSEVSGRGVGMDVVKTNIERLGGTVDIDSTVGKGSKITMKLPLTLAIIPSLIVRSENRRFAIPQVGLEEVVRIRANDLTNKIERINNAEILRLRGRLLPLVRLTEVLGIPATFVDPISGEHHEDRRNRWSDRRKKDTAELSSTPVSPDVTTEVIQQSPQSDEDAQIQPERRKQGNDRRTNVKNALKVVVLKMDAKVFGLVVDDVQDSEEIVVKPLPEYLKSSICYAGSTIMGDGKVAMILDPNGIASMAKLNFNVIDKEIETEKKRFERQGNKKLENLLLFHIGGPERFGINLSAISRIEKRSVDDIQYVGSKEFLHLDNCTLRLLRLENYLPIQPPQQQLTHLFVIIPKNTTYPFGIVTQKVEDTVQIELNLNKETVKSSGLAGSTMINNKLTLVIDISSFVTNVEHEFST